MYFILSKILLFLILPFNWFLILLVFAFIYRKKNTGRRLFIAALTVLYLFSIPALFKGFTKMWDVASMPPKSNRQYSCVIVLGGFGSRGGADGGHFNGAADRYIAGVELLITHKVQHILITGGSASLTPDSFREATWARLHLKKLGIADSLILTESNARNTLENARFSKQLLIKKNLKGPYLLVTAAFHMRRAQMIFKKNGIAVVPYSCYPVVDNLHLKLTDFLPDAEVLSYWQLYTKEVVGYIANYF